MDSLETIGILGFGEYEVGVAAVAFSTNTLRDELLVTKVFFDFFASTILQVVRRNLQVVTSLQVDKSLHSVTYLQVHIYLKFPHIYLFPHTY